MEEATDDLKAFKGCNLPIMLRASQISNNKLTSRYLMGQGHRNS